MVGARTIGLKLEGSLGFPPLNISLTRPWHQLLGGSLLFRSIVEYSVVRK